MWWVYPIHHLSVPIQFQPLGDDSLLDFDKFQLPNLKNDCCITKSELKNYIDFNSKYPGGEILSLERLSTHLTNIKWICKFEKPETSPNSLDPSTTVLSPYLKFGCLSVKYFRAQLIKTYANGNKTAEN